MKKNRNINIIRITFALAFVSTLIVSVRANNITVSNMSLTGQNTSAGANNAANYSMVKFDVSWDNSWRTATGPSNWDAAWVFVKFRVGESDPTFTGVSSSGTTVTVSSTAKLRVGMPVVVISGTGAFAANTLISSITNSTQFVVSATPSTALSNAGIACRRIWEHAAIDTTDANHTAPSGSVINAPNDSTGVFIYRSTAGSGTNNWDNVSLRWKYGSNGLANDTYLEVKVFAIEMVYVPEGSFYVGSGGTETGSFTDGSWTSGATIPFQITSEAALGIDNAAGKLWGTSSTGNSFIGNYAASAEATLAAAFPKGYAAFYCMKYEMSQGQYRDFLNALNYAQQVNRTVSSAPPNSAVGTGALSSANANRNGLDIQTPGNATTLVPAVYGCNLDGDGTYNEDVDGEWIACNFLSWMDGCAYMDWAGLRPMTELEFEKACRGNQAAVAGEYAWGDTTTTSANNITNDGQAGEVTNTANANSSSASQANVQGPLRVGAFVGAATTRAQAGATYYGIMEMSGNLWERAVTVGNAAGRSFTGLHGDGNLFRDGSANVDFWPGINGKTSTDANTAFMGTTGVTQAAGSGFRGGSYSLAITIMRVSDRNDAGFTAPIAFANRGFRGVRTAP